MFGSWQGINLMSLSASLVDYKNNQYFTKMKFSPTTLILNKNKFKRFTQWSLVPLGPAIIFTTE